MRLLKSLYRWSTDATHCLISLAWAWPFSTKLSASWIRSLTLSRVSFAVLRNSLCSLSNPSVSSLLMPTKLDLEERYASPVLWIHSIACLALLSKRTNCWHWSRDFLRSDGAHAVSLWGRTKGKAVFGALSYLENRGKTHWEEWTTRIMGALQKIGVLNL